MTRRRYIAYVLCLMAAVAFIVAAWEFHLVSVFGFETPVDESPAEKWLEILFVTLVAGLVAGYCGWTVIAATAEKNRLAWELEEKARLLEITLEAMDQGICVYDKDLKLTLWNEHYIDLADQPREMVVKGRPALDMIRQLAEKGVFDGDDMEEVSRRREEFYFRRGRPSREERRRADGRVIDIRRNPMPDGGFVSSFTDVTAMKTAERKAFEAMEAAERANSAKTQFLAQMSHELRTPLNAIIGFSDLIADNSRLELSPERVREMAGNIKLAGEHLSSLVGDILDVSAIEAGRIDIEENTSILAELVDDAVAMVSADAGRRGIEMEVDLACGDDVIRGDGRRLSQALLNILGNALKFTSRGGRVAVHAARTKDGGMRIDVADTGVGIASDDLERVIKPFERVDHHEQKEGVGLGLAITNAIMELHGGRLSIESRPGEGSVVTLTLPSSRILPAERLRAEA